MSIPHQHRLMRRREVLRASGAGGLGIAAAAIGLPTGIRSMNGADTSLQEFLESAYATRARAALNGHVAQLDRIYGESTQALAFERERASFLSKDLGTMWGGTPIDLRSVITIDAMEIIGDEARVRLTERLGIDWVPRPAGTVPPEIQQLRRDNPRKAVDVFRGPRDEIASSVLVPHELNLLRGIGQWRIVRDQHDEFFLYQRSPDLKPGSWAAIWYGKIPGAPGGPPAPLQSSLTPGPPQASSMAFAFTAYSYDPLAADSYAQQYAQNPYFAYCNYDLCGGDCTNFVSQCYRQGGEIDQSPWATNAGACGTCGTYATYMGSDTWANVGLMTDFMLTHGGRATTRATVNNLGDGDHINYQDAGGYRYHKTIITGLPFSSQPLVCSHSPFLLNAPYNTGQLAGASSYQFIWMETSYTA
jgi:hypothetical protein